MTTGRTHRYSHFPVIGCACHTCNYCRDKIGMADAPAEGTPELLRGFDTMTTTPDSRIRADWHLDALPGPECALQPIDTSTTATPDTSTTAGKVAVMQAYDRGEAVQARRLGLAEWSVPKTRKDTGDDPCWDWSMYDYRIAPPPVGRTALQAAREYTMTAPDKVNASSMARLLVALLQDIDYSPVVEVLERRISWDAADLSALPKGRYRLVRDDA